jgi:hypothetical protein
VRFTEPLVPWISMAHRPRRPQKITGGPAVWPCMVRGIRDARAVARTLLVPGYRLDGGGTAPADAAALHVGCHTPGQQGAPAWPAWPAECNDRPWVNWLPVSRCRASFRSPLADLRCTCGGPSCTSRDGTDGGVRSKDPSPAQS